MFLENKYRRWYFNLINKRLKIKIPSSDYSEKHHIIPLSLGGSNDQSNVVRLTAREHYIAHLLLVKMTNGINKRKMAHALSIFNAINNKNQKRYKPKSKLYELSRRVLSETLKGYQPSENCRLAVSKAKKGKPLTEEQRKKLSKSLKRNKPVLIITNNNEIIKLNDFRELNLGLSNHTLCDKIYQSEKTQYFSIMTSGKFKGWIFHYDTNILINLNEINEYRKKSLEQSKTNRSNAIKLIHKQKKEDKK